MEDSELLVLFIIFVVALFLLKNPGILVHSLWLIRQEDLAVDFIEGIIDHSPLL